MRAKKVGDWPLPYEWLFVYESSRKIDFSITKKLYLKLEFSKKEWKNLITFLKKTRNTDFLPKDCEGVNEFSIPDNKVSYFSAKKCLQRIKKQNKLDKRRMKQMLVQDLDTLKRYPVVGRGILLRKGDLTIILPRKKFYELRENCLNDEEAQRWHMNKLLLEFDKKKRKEKKKED